MSTFVSYGRVGIDLYLTMEIFHNRLQFWNCYCFDFPRNSEWQFMDFVSYEPALLLFFMAKIAPSQPNIKEERLCFAFTNFNVF